MNKNVHIIGAYNTKFGNLKDETIYSLYEEAAKAGTSGEQSPTIAWI